MSRLSSALLLLALFLVSVPPMAHADDTKPDDRVIFDVAAEDWVDTKTARVIVNIEASVQGNAAGTTRVIMTKALEGLLKTDWRLISFDRDEDATGLEHWSAMYEARVPENQLSGIHESAKKASKPGLQLSVSGIDFSPTLDEVQTAMSLLRARIYKMANDQLAALNAALPGRTYRIAMINFTQDAFAGAGGAMMADMNQMGGARGPRVKAMMAQSVETSSAPAPMERSEKLTMTARVVYAVTPQPVAK